MDVNKNQELYWRERALNIDSKRNVSIADPWQRDIELNFFLQYLSKTDNVLEIGCGNGYMSPALSSRAAFVNAIDFLPEMIERAKKENEGILNVKFEVGDACNLEFPDNSFDKIVCTRVLINMSDGLLQMKAIKEFSRVLKPNGELLILEGILESFDYLNEYRSILDLQPIYPAQVNNYLNHDFFKSIIATYFDELTNFDIGFYDLITRVLLPFSNVETESKIHEKIREGLYRLGIADNKSFAKFSRLYGGRYKKVPIIINE